MEEVLKNISKESRSRLVAILLKGLIRCVNDKYKSSNIADSKANKDSQNVAYELGSFEDKSVDVDHEN